jgi:hypothetical protein
MPALLMSFAFGRAYDFTTIVRIANKIKADSDLPGQASAEGWPRGMEVVTRYLQV